MYYKSPNHFTAYCKSSISQYYYVVEYLPNKYIVKFQLDIDTSERSQYFSF